MSIRAFVEQPVQANTHQNNVFDGSITAFVEQNSGTSPLFSLDYTDLPPSGGKRRRLKKAEGGLPPDTKAKIAALVREAVLEVGYDTVKAELANHAPRPPERPQMSKADLAEFFAHAEANPWNREGDTAPSAHIQGNFSRWFDLGLTLDHIAQAQPDVIAEYKKEIVRNPRKRIRQLTRPHKLSDGSIGAPSTRLVSELSDEELARVREDRNQRQARFRLRRGAKAPGR
jgi:hypothetical protein